MEKTDKEHKSTMISAIAEALDNNTNSLHDVWCFLHALQNGLDFMDDKRYKYRSDLSMSLRHLRESFNNNDSEQMLFDDLTDDIQEVIMLAGANAEGLLLANSKGMRAELDSIIETYSFA